MSAKLSDKDIRKLADMFNIYWAAIALNPQNLRTEIGLLKHLGLVEKRGKLALTPAGRRVFKFSRTPSP